MCLPFGPGEILLGVVARFTDPAGVEKADQRLLLVRKVVDDAGAGAGTAAVTDLDGCAAGEALDD